MVPLLHPPPPQITALMHCFRLTFVIFCDPGQWKKEERWGIDSCANERETKKISAGHNNSMDIGDPGIDGKEL